MQRIYSTTTTIHDDDAHRPNCVMREYNICVANLKGNGRVRRARPGSANMWVVCLLCVFMCDCVYLYLKLMVRG